MRTAGNGLQSKPLILTAVIVATLFCSAGIATGIGWGVFSGAALGDRAGLHVFAPLRGDAGRSAIETTRSDIHPRVAIERPATRCSGCGVIESIRALGTRDGTTVVCAVNNWIDLDDRGNAWVDAALRDLATLAEITSEIVARDSSAKNVRAAGYELTIRFRDGVRRTIKLTSHGQWQLGDRILVINSET